MRAHVSVFTLYFFQKIYLVYPWICFTTQNWEKMQRIVSEKIFHLKKQKSFKSFSIYQRHLSKEYMFCASGMDLLWGRKIRGRNFISESEIFNSEIKWTFFEIGQLPKSSAVRFWQSRWRKKDHLIEEMEILARRKEKGPRVLLPKKQVNSRGTDIFFMFLTRDDPTTRSRIVPWST